MAMFNPQTFLTQVDNGKTTLMSPKKQVLFSQGDTMDAVFYDQADKVKLTVVSPHYRPPQLRACVRLSLRAGTSALASATSYFPI